MSTLEFCKLCEKFDCKKHPKVPSTTERLTKLLFHFEEPNDDNMRTYIEPEKSVGAQTLIDARTTTIPSNSTKNYRFSEESVGMSRSESPTQSHTEKPITSSAMIRIGNDNQSAPTVRQMLQAANNTPRPGSTPENPIKLTGGRYRAHERHHFVKINATSFMSCSSPSGSYSDLAFVLWIDNKHYARYPSSNDRYRIIISLLFDAEEDLWYISARLLKRTSYSAKDDEEGMISNRICKVTELRSEIKKMLLFLGISPRQAYRFFRENMKEQVVISDTGAGFVTVETESNIALSKELEKPSTGYHGGSSYDLHGYGSHSHAGRQHGYGPWQHNKDADARNRSVMFGGAHGYDEYGD